MQDLYAHIYPETPSSTAATIHLSKAEEAALGLLLAADVGVAGAAQSAPTRLLWLMSAGTHGSGGTSDLRRARWCRSSGSGSSPGHWRRPRICSHTRRSMSRDHVSLAWTFSKGFWEGGRDTHVVAPKVAVGAECGAVDSTGEGVCVSSRVAGDVNFVSIVFALTTSKVDLVGVIVFLAAGKIDLVSLILPTTSKVHHSTITLLRPFSRGSGGDRTPLGRGRLDAATRIGRAAAAATVEIAVELEAIEPAVGGVGVVLVASARRGQDQAATLMRISTSEVPAVAPGSPRSKRCTSWCTGSGSPEHSRASEAPTR